MLFCMIPAVAVSAADEIVYKPIGDVSEIYAVDRTTNSVINLLAADGHYILTDDIVWGGVDENGNPIPTTLYVYENGDLLPESVQVYGCRYTGQKAAGANGTYVVHEIIDDPDSVYANTWSLGIFPSKDFTGCLDGDDHTVNYKGEFRVYSGMSGGFIAPSGFNAANKGLVQDNNYAVYLKDITIGSKDSYFKMNSAQQNTGVIAPSSGKTILSGVTVYAHMTNDLLAVVDSTKSSNMGMLFSKLAGNIKIDDCRTYGTVTMSTTGVKAVGGMVAQFAPTSAKTIKLEISNCVSNVTLAGTPNGGGASVFGGMVGKVLNTTADNTLTMTNCLYLGELPTHPKYTVGPMCAALEAKPKNNTITLKTDYDSCIGILGCKEGSDVVDMVDGASLKLTDDAAGRRLFFKTYVNSTIYTTLKDTFGESNVRFGTLVTDKTIYDALDAADKDFTLDNVNAYIDDPNSDGGVKSEIEDLPNAYGYYTGRIVIFGDSDLDKEYCARAYVKYTFDDEIDEDTEWITVYADDVIVRTPSDVAEKALADQKKPDDIPNATIRSYYRYEVEGTDGLYSPYTAEQREMIAAYIPAPAVDNGNGGDGGNA